MGTTPRKPYQRSRRRDELLGDQKFLHLNGCACISEYVQATPSCPGRILCMELSDRSRPGDIRILLDVTYGGMHEHKYGA